MNQSNTPYNQKNVENKVHMPLRSPILAWDHDTHTPPGAIASFINSDTNRTPYTPLDPNNLLPKKHIVIDREALESDYSKLLEDIKDFV